jgi:hypothetical protein
MCLVSMFGVAVLLAGCGQETRQPRQPAGTPRPGGYFQLVGVGQLGQLPTDGEAAGMVHRSTWEPRHVNDGANHIIPPADFKTRGYSGMVDGARVFGRIDGNFTGTTDEIIQWAAAKWGLPDDVIRAEAVQESYWYQDLRHGGRPIEGRGYGDFGACGGSPAPSGYGAKGPASFGLLQDKWCSFKDPDAPGYDGWPWSERSTAYSVDLYAGALRGCFEGLDTWLARDNSGYRAGDLWGCVGRWFSGAWYSPDAKKYIALVRSNYSKRPWLNW